MADGSMSGAVVTASLLREPAPRKHLEDDIQRSIVKFARWALPHDAMLIAVPNGGKRHSAAAARLVGLGVTAGVTDLILWFRGRTLGIEVKAPAGYLSAVQKQTQKRMALCGVNAVVVRSVDEFETVLRGFGVPLTMRVSA